MPHPEVVPNAPTERLKHQAALIRSLCVDDPAIGGSGPVLEYAVKMREFSQDALLSRMLSRGALTAAHIDALALKVGAFHGSIQVAKADGRSGRPDDILRLAQQNFTQIRPLIGDASEGAGLDRLCEWTQQEYAARLKLLLGRK